MIQNLDIQIWICLLFFCWIPFLTKQCYMLIRGSIRFKPVSLLAILFYYGLAFHTTSNTLIPAWTNIQLKDCHTHCNFLARIPASFPFSGTFLLFQLSFFFLQGVTHIHNLSDILWHIIIKKTYSYQPLSQKKKWRVRKLMIIVYHNNFNLALRFTSSSDAHLLRICRVLHWMHSCTPWFYDTKV